MEKLNEKEIAYAPRFKIEKNPGKTETILSP